MFKKQFALLLLLVGLFQSACQTTAPSPSHSPSEPLTVSTDIDTLIADLETGRYGEIHSLLIWHQDSLLVEEYFRGYNQTRPHELYSVTKSITSAAIGIALAQGQIPAVETPLFELLPDYADLAETDPQKQAITLEHVLAMSTGFEWDELSAIYGSADNSTTQLTRSSDWLEYVLARPQAAPPGTTFTYNSGNTMLLSGVIAAQTDGRAEEYVDQVLLSPLGIDDWRWDRGRPNLTNTGWGLHLTPRDMLAIGRLHLDEGRWQGEQLIPAAWVQQSTAVQIASDNDFDYGYQWWRYSDQNPLVSELAVNDVYFAWGFGGQFIWVVPHLDLVIVTTAHNFEDSAQIFPILPDVIFPWVQSSLS